MAAVLFRQNMAEALVTAHIVAGRESLRLKYRSGSGNLIFNGSGSRLFKNLGLGSVAPKFKGSVQVQ